MNTIYAGKKLLELLEKERGQLVQAKTFFDEEFWPLMFKSEDHQHLMQVHGSDYFQPAYPGLAQKKGMSVIDFRKYKFDENLKNTATGVKAPTGNIGVGFMAGGPAETTFGQVSDLQLKFTEEELLCSWYGGALGIGFGGGVDFLSFEPEIMRFIYSGWSYYRKLIHETPNLKGRQIETWNGLWLLYGLKYRDKPEAAYRELSQNVGNHTSTTGGVVKLDRPEWSRQILTLAIEFGGGEHLSFQGYNFGSTNKTYGLLAVHLPKIKWMSHLYDHLIQQEDGLESKQITEIFESHFSLSRAAQFGELGLRAITPKNLPQYLGSNAPDLKKINNEKRKSPYQFTIYKSWIIAMLNNDELHDLAQNMAKELLAYKKLGKTAHSTEADKVKNIEALWPLWKDSRIVDQISLIVCEITKPSEVFAKVIKAVATEMTPDQLRLFISLTRFEYIYRLGYDSENYS